MRAVSVVCDNHTARPAVATYYSATFNLGARAVIILTPGGGRWLDLCEECAAVLGWTPPQEERQDDEGDEPVTDAQRRLIFARCRDLNLDEDERHALLASVTGDPSMRNLLAKDVDRVLAALDAVEAGAVFPVSR